MARVQLWCVCVWGGDPEILSGGERHHYSGEGHRDRWESPHLGCERNSGVGRPTSRGRLASGWVPHLAHGPPMSLMRTISNSVREQHCLVPNCGEFAVETWIGFNQYCRPISASWAVASCRPQLQPIGPIAKGCVARSHADHHHPHEPTDHPRYVAPGPLGPWGPQGHLGGGAHSFRCVSGGGGASRGHRGVGGGRAAPSSRSPGHGIARFYTGGSPAGSGSRAVRWEVAAIPARIARADPWPGWGRVPHSRICMDVAGSAVAASLAGPWQGHSRSSCSRLSVVNGSSQGGGWATSGMERHT